MSHIVGTASDKRKIKDAITHMRKARALLRNMEDHGVNANTYFLIVHNVQPTIEALQKFLWDIGGDWEEI